MYVGTYVEVLFKIELIGYLNRIRFIDLKKQIRITSK